MKKRQQLTEQEAKAELWRLGELSWKLNWVQKELKAIVDSDTTKTSVVVVSRRTGKTWWLLIESMSVCLRKAGAVVKFIFPLQTDAKKNIYPLMLEILEDCPDDLRPHFNTQDKEWIFPNGSKIQLAGCNNGGVDSIRGGRADLCVVDEAGFCDNLRYAIRAVLSPTIRTTGGKIIMASTPSVSPDHEFIKDFMLPYQAADRLKIFTIWDNPNFDETIRQEIVSEYPMGVDDPDFKREYLCHIGINEEAAIVPEFAQMEEQIVLKNEEFPLPNQFATFYVALDPGMLDLTAILLCYYDFEEACLYVMDEITIAKKQARTDVIAKKLKDAERINFTFEGDHDPTTPMLRVMDLDLRLQADLLSLHDLLFTCTAKDNLAAAVNKMRVWISQGRVKIHERCKNLRYHLKYGQWNDTRTKFKHLAGTNDGAIPKSHVDTIPPLYYLIRNLYEHYNPKPANYDRIVTTSTHKRKNYEENTGTWNEISKALTKFARKRR